MHTAMWPTRTIFEPRRTLDPPPSPPLVRGLARHPHLGCDMRNRTARRDPLDHDHAAARRHRSVTVHESLLGPGVDAATATPCPGGSTHPRTHVTNVGGQHN